MKKTIAAIALIAIMAVNLVACGNNADKNSAANSSEEKSTFPNYATEGNMTIGYPGGWSETKQTGGALLGMEAGESITITSPDDKYTLLMIAEAADKNTSIEDIEATLSDQGITYTYVKIDGNDALRIDTYGGTVNNAGESSDRGKVIGICTTDNGNISATAALVVPQTKYDSDKDFYDAIIDSVSVK